MITWKIKLSWRNSLSPKLISKKSHVHFYFYIFIHRIKIKIKMTNVSNEVPIESS